MSGTPSDNFPTLPDKSDTDALLKSFAAGNLQAQSTLLSRYRVRLRKLVGMRLDQRIAKRVDPSDIIQETLILASKRMDEYAKKQPLPFYPWLRQLAIEQIIQHHRRHIKSLGRSVQKEVDVQSYLPNQAVSVLSGLLVVNEGEASAALSRQFKQQLVQEVLAQLRETDREVLMLRFIEQLSIAETADVLQSSQDAIKSRQRRALERFASLYSQRLGK